jgi:hypothetical protein
MFAPVNFWRIVPRTLKSKLLNPNVGIEYGFIRAMNRQVAVEGAARTDNADGHAWQDGSLLRQL